MAMDANGRLERSNNKMPVARVLGRSCRKAFEGFEGWQTAGLNDLATDGHGGKRQA